MQTLAQIAVFLAARKNSQVVRLISTECFWVPQSIAPAGGCPGDRDGSTRVLIKCVPAFSLLWPGHFGSNAWTLARSAQARVATNERGTGLVREQRIPSAPEFVGFTFCRSPTRLHAPMVRVRTTTDPSVLAVESVSMQNAIGRQSKQ